MPREIAVSIFRLAARNKGIAVWAELLNLDGSFCRTLCDDDITIFSMFHPAHDGEAVLQRMLFRLAAQGAAGKLCLV